MLTTLGMLPLMLATWTASPDVTETPLPIEREVQSLRAAVEDLTATFGKRYPQGPVYRQRLDDLARSAQSGDRTAARRLAELRREALLANPLLDFGRLLVVKRRPQRGPTGLGFPSNHECNTSLRRDGYDNEIAVLSPIRPGGTLATLHRPLHGGYVGEIDLYWDADRLLFSQSDAENWKVWEVRSDGSAARQVSQAPGDVDCFDACYLPDGGIVFGSTASYQSVPCWHGQRHVSNLYRMNADGTGMRQLCFDQDHDFHPCVLPNGQILYHRWDYTGINHIFLRQLMVMNPDGTGQRAVYGSNSWFPNAIYFPRPISDEPSRWAAVVSGYHGVHRMGQLVLIDAGRGWHEADGLVQRISGRGEPVRPKIADNLVDDDWPKFLHPYPLSEKYFLVACCPGPKAAWGIYLADVFDNLVLVREEPGYALLEPVPLKKTPRPPIIPDRVDPSSSDAVVYLHDVYTGPGLAGVPRGTAKQLRVVAYHFGYRGLAGPDKIGCGGPWEAMRILGTVPLESDGSAVFRVPANTPLAVQVLDHEGKAVQLMRSWFTAMPGEKLSCVGCHETPAEAATLRPAIAALREPRAMTPWYGPPRGFDFAREVQPVLDAHCVACHDGKPEAWPDLRAEQLRPDYRGRPISQLGIDRLHPAMREATGGVLRYTPAYEALLPYVRRVGIEDDVSLLVPGEYHADTSELIQMLRKGHEGVELDAESWDRLITWLDLNAPCHGAWGEVYPIPDGAHQRRMELRRRYGGPTEDPEARPVGNTSRLDPLPSPISGEGQGVRAPVRRGSPDPAVVATEGLASKTLDLGEGVTMRLVRIPAGEFVLGSEQGEPDERPTSRVTIARPFWMGVCEVTNEQYGRFDPTHDSRYYARRHARSDDQGLPLDGPKQPVLRVSWDQATAFCRWLSEKTGSQATLPTEVQWEYACRAGSETALFFGNLDADFSPWANLADQSFSVGLVKDGKQITGGLEHLVLEGADLADRRFHDRAVVTADVGSYRPNAWGLLDMHGNTAEWTLTTYRSYPYQEAADPGSRADANLKVVRGGSFFDRPVRCRSSFRLAYPAWQRVFNVGFRVVVE